MAVATDTAEPTPSTAKRNGAGTAALVIGVNALVLAVLIIFIPIAAILAIIAVILGAVGMKRASRGEADNRGHATAGLMTGLIALAFAVVMGIRIGTFINDHQGDFRRFWTCITSAPTDAQQNDCGRELARALD